MTDSGLTKNLKLYIRLYNEYDETEDPDLQDGIQEKIEELWYELNDDEIAYIEINNLSI